MPVLRDEDEPGHAAATASQGTEKLPDNITGQTTLTIKGRDVCGTERDLDENAYGAAFVALVREVTALSVQMRTRSVKASTIVRLSSSTGLMLVNLVLQFMLLNYIGSYVVEPAVRNVQTLYQDFHSQVFDSEGQIDQSVWTGYPMTDQVCQITMADKTFYYIILLLWALRILDELRKIQRQIDDICGCSGCSEASEMLEFTEDATGDGAGACLITHLTAQMRWLLLILVIMPRTFIAVRLLLLGCRWLSASASFSDMVLNAMALAFVTDIDERLYCSVLPNALKKQIADTNFFFEEEPKGKAQVDRSEWKMYKRTLAWLVLTSLFLFTYGEFLQTVLPNDLSDLRSHCSTYTERNASPICSLPTTGGQSKTCYPFDTDISHGMAAGHVLTRHELGKGHHTRAAHAHGHR